MWRQILSRSLSLQSRVPSIKRVSFSSVPEAQVTYPSPDVKPSTSASVEDTEITKGLISAVNERLEPENAQEAGRLFAVVYLCGKQFKVTQDDIIMIEHIRPWEIGDKIQLEKVLMVGGKDFSLFGRPMLPSNSVDIEATVIEKTLSFVVPDFFFVRRKDIRFLRFLRHPQSMLRINRIRVNEKIPESS